MNPYPLAGDYQAALQNPGAAFTVTSLRRAQFAADGWGLPAAITGTSAAVFHATIGGGAYALRCFTRQDASSPERYAAFDSFVAGQGLGQHVGQVTWHDDAVRAKGATWPVLQMEWIEGQQLNEYAGYLAERTNTDALGKLASQWLKLVDELQRVRFAHGDLQHGNVIIDLQGRLRLVDFDGVWIPPLQGHPPPTEMGHENYQPRGRSVLTRWGPWMDTFSALVIYVALTALARDPGLWLPLNNGDNLLFERRDFSVPFETDVWKHLARVGDAEVDRLADKLKTCCVPGWVATKGLTAMIEQTWWERTRVSPTSDATGGPAPVNPRAPVDFTPRPAQGPHRSAQTGSVPLPPPPAWPYQTKVAPQAQASAPSPSGTSPPAQLKAKGAGSMPTSKAGIPVWWQPQAPTPPAAPPAPVKPTSSSGRIAGQLCIIIASILFVALVAHYLVAAVIIGVVGAGIGSWLIRNNPKKPPGQLPPSGTSQGPK